MVSDVDDGYFSARTLGCEISGNPLDPLEPIMNASRRTTRTRIWTSSTRLPPGGAPAFPQRRKCEPYIIHPLAVSQILADLGMGPLVVAAGLLHDGGGHRLHAGGVPRHSATVTGLVDGVTKLSKMEYAIRRRPRPSAMGWR